MIYILDCTLRDGGYVNSFSFGRKNITKIIDNLSLSGIEIIECGFLKSNKDNDNLSLYNNTNSIKKMIKKKTEGTMYVAMIAYGDIDIQDIETCTEDGIDGIRLTFHESEISQAFEFAKQLMEKGYKVFIQPVGTATYKDENLINLINMVNKIKPFAFYLVDTLGTMYKKDLLRMFYLVDHNLDCDIKIGFHSHNNLQLSFSNAQELVLLHSKRDIIIDSSILGMGRGAGNLCTELFAQYINENVNYKYDLIYILELMDEIIMPIYKQFSWGYSAPYYLAAVNGCHPNYANYLIDKQSLFIQDINEILKRIPSEKKHIFDKSLIKNLYIEYQNHEYDDSLSIESIKCLCKNRKVLLIAPGKTAVKFKTLVDNYISANNPVVIAVNHIPELYDVDKIFISNLRRFKSVDNINNEYAKQLIITSNITTNENMCVFNYVDYILGSDAVLDNSGLMLVNILKKCDVKDFAFAGFDGISNDNDNGFFGNNFSNEIENINQDIINSLMLDYFNQLKNTFSVTFVTESIFDK